MILTFSIRKFVVFNLNKEQKKQCRLNIFFPGCNLYTHLVYLHQTILLFFFITQIASAFVGKIHIIKKLQKKKRKKVYKKLKVKFVVSTFKIRG